MTDTDTTADQLRPAFDPKQHLIHVNRKDYLPVAWRLVWLREDYPNATITTDLLRHAGGVAIFRSTVVLLTDDGEVEGTATAHAEQAAHEWGDYLEKCETKATGRALAMLGYGAEYANELDDTMEAARAPREKQPESRSVPAQQTKPAKPGADTTSTAAAHSGPTSSQATRDQQAAIKRLAERAKLSDSALLRFIQNTMPHVVDLYTLTQADAAQIIMQLQMEAALVK